MCFHNSLSKTAQEVKNRFKAKYDETGDLFEPVYHATAFAFPKWPVITTEKPETLELFNWGLIPHWASDMEDAKKSRQNCLNAKSETVFEKPSFRFSINKKRCIVPSTGFFEWREVDKKKYPYFIKLKDEDIFAMAGIFQHWVDKSTGELFNTFSILTTEANPLMATIHNSKKRMPVIIPKDREAEWLTMEMTQENIKSFFTPYPQEKMMAHTISKLITSKLDNPNVPEVTEEFDYAEVDPL